MRLRLLLPAFLALWAASAAAETVDLRLVLAADVSRSIDYQEFELQRGGYAAAFDDPRVLRAIRGGATGKIAVCYVEWSDSQQVVIDWTVIGDEESAGAFADKLRSIPRPFSARTAIGDGLAFAMMQFDRAGHDSPRRTIDVSGDGTNTNGLPPSAMRDRAVAAGITVNGIVILSPPEPFAMWHTNPPGGLDEYYRQNVMGGPGSFVMVAEDFQSFAFAITNKLVREIADGAAPASISVAAAPRER